MRPVETGRQGRSLLNNRMTGQDPHVTRIVKDEEGNSIITRRREGSAEESTVVVAAAVLQNMTITPPHPVEAEVTTISTREGSVEENLTTHGDGSREGEVNRESSIHNVHIGAGRGHGTVSIRHPQDNNVDPGGRIGMGRLNTRPRTTITKTPGEGEGRRTPGETSDGKSSRSFNSEVVWLTDNGAGWHRETGRQGRSLLNNRMTGQDPHVTRIVKDEEGNSTITRRREGSAEESTVVVAAAVLQNMTITPPHPVEAEVTTISTREGSVEENLTTHGDGSREGEVN